MAEYSKLGISNDFMFGRIMRDEELCRMFLEVLLNIKINRVKFVERQKDINDKLGTHGVRLDIYVNDGKTIFDVEMQVTPSPDLPRRSRYYQGIIDLNGLKPGELYGKLKKSFVIFVCAFDPFGKDRYIYTFQNMCLEESGLCLQDDAIKVFVNTKGHIGEYPETVKELIHFLDTSEIKNYRTPLVSKLAEALQNARERNDWRDDYMSYEMKLLEEKTFALEKGRKEGRKEGREEGREEGTQFTLFSLLKQGLLSKQNAIANSGISEAKFMKGYNAYLKAEGKAQTL